MCLIAFALQAHDDFVLLVAANRDEFHARAASAATWWSDAPRVWGGRDRVAGGSWLAVDRSGRFAAVTNVRDPAAPPGPRSRGALVADFVASDVPLADYADRVAGQAAEFAGFNLVLFDPAAAQPLLYVSNRHPQRIVALPPGVHGLSNGVPGSDWPKVRRLVGRLDRVLADPRLRFEAELLDALADRTRPPDHELPDTGIGLARERTLASALIEAPEMGYGTRASTIVALRRDGRIELLERSWAPAGERARIAGERRARFTASRRKPVR